jgi:glycosyltransferase involved in cell wall biosynthesis
VTIAGRTATPSVCVVVPTRDRPALLARAVASILAQNYPGELEVLIVVDQDDPASATAELPPDRRVRVVTNTRKPGLSGTRNTGIMLATTDLVAFCDDDDEWLPRKLARQVRALTKVAGAEFATCSIEVDFEGSRSVRLAGRRLITHDDLLPSRMSMLHSSTFLIGRTALIDDIGLIDENVPGSQNEDWDLLLRASARAPIVHVDDPLVRVYWSSRSYFSRDWETKIASRTWMLERHPDIAASRKGSARVYGQIAFAYAASGQRGMALRWSSRAIKRRWKEPRAYLAMATVVGVPAEVIMRALHKRGHGI